MSHDPYLEACTSRCKKQLLKFRASTSDHTTAENSPANLVKEDANRCKRMAELKQLEGRLRVLEEEAEMLKGALSETVEERTKLMSEINEHFDTLQNCLLQRELKNNKERRAGLLQVLCQESNPSIVKKGLRTKTLG